MQMLQMRIQSTPQLCRKKRREKIITDGVVSDDIKEGVNNYSLFFCRRKLQGYSKLSFEARAWITKMRNMGQRSAVSET